MLFKLENPSIILHFRFSNSSCCNLSSANKVFIISQLPLSQNIDNSLLHLGLNPGEQPCLLDEEACRVQKCHTLNESIGDWLLRFHQKMYLAR